MTLRPRNPQPHSLRPSRLCGEKKGRSTAETGRTQRFRVRAGVPSPLWVFPLAPWVSRIALPVVRLIHPGFRRTHSVVRGARSATPGAPAGGRVGRVAGRGIHPGFRHTPARGRVSFLDSRAIHLVIPARRSVSFWDTFRVGGRGARVFGVGLRWFGGGMRVAGAGLGVGAGGVSKNGTRMDTGVAGMTKCMRGMTNCIQKVSRNGTLGAIGAGGTVLTPTHPTTLTRRSDGESMSKMKSKKRRDGGGGSYVLRVTFYAGRGGRLVKRET